MTYSLESIVRGWNLSGQKAGTELLAGVGAPQVDLMIDDGATLRAPESREVLGEPRNVWVPLDSLREGLYGNMAAAVGKRALSGANTHKNGSIRTIALLQEFSGDPEALECAAIAACLVGLSTSRSDMSEILRGATTEALAKIGFLCVQDVWARSNSMPMPVQPIEALMRFDASCGGEELGQLLRMWHDVTFAKFAGVSATPVRFGAGTLRLSDFEAICSGIARGLNGGYGNVTWKTLGVDMLRDLVWEEPVMHLARRFGVSDVAVKKRCRAKGVTVPPRGYWQKIEAGLDPRPLLEKNGVVAPKAAEAALSAKFGELPMTA